MSAQTSSLALRVAVFLGFFSLATLMHVASGAYSSGFGGFEDEPAHLVTSLMIRDWLASGDFANPQAFVENYYVHYPKVGIGQWPPVFHGLLGVWMLIVGTSTAAVVAFLTLVTTMTAYVVCAIVRKPFGEAAGIIAGVMFLAVPIVEECSASAMTEMLIALFGLLAVLAFGRYLESGKARWVFGFAGFSALTILTKGSGLALVLVPFLSILFGRRFDVLRRPSFWLAGLTVGLIAGPWYYFTIEFNQSTWAGGGSPSLDYARFAASEFAGWLPRLTGVVGLALVPVGYVWALRHGRRHGRWNALAAWLPAVAILHLVIPSSVEERHLAALAPTWVIFTTIGAGALVHLVWRRAGAGARETAAALGIGAALVAMVIGNGSLPTKHWSGWGGAARDLVSRGENAPSRMLVGSDPVGEGLFVAGFALADHERPNRIVLRASKVLGNANWSGREYERRFGTSGAIIEYLRATGIGIVVIDESVRGTRHWYAHMDQLTEAVAGPETSWVPIGSWDVTRQGELAVRALRAYLDPNWGSLNAPELTLEDVLRQSKVE